MSAEAVSENWEILKRFLPDSWEEKATTLGALVRKRKIPNADTLLRVLLIHLADGKSLRTTATYAEEAGICKINDVALLHRLKASSEWFRWMAVKLAEKLNYTSGPDFTTGKHRIRLVDSTIVSEPGSTGTDWRIHYSFCLKGLTCTDFIISGPKEGESLLRFSVEQGDLIIGDRGFCKRKGILHVLNRGGNVLTRFHSRALPLFTRKGVPWVIQENIRSLKAGDIGDWDVWVEDPKKGSMIKGRLCVIKKSNEAAKRTRKQIISYATKKKHKTFPLTLELADYFCLFTTLNRHTAKKEDLLNLYRGRWQIELAFKRLKSIIGIGHLPKSEEDSCIAWLHGKMFIALLTESMYQEALFFSPWGYPIRHTDSNQKSKT